MAYPINKSKYDSFVGKWHDSQMSFEVISVVSEDDITLPELSVELRSKDGVRTQLVTMLKNTDELRKIAHH